jgi:hypothetical protein
MLYATLLHYNYRNLQTEKQSLSQDYARFYLYHKRINPALNCNIFIQLNYILSKCSPNTILVFFSMIGSRLGYK